MQPVVADDPDYSWGWRNLAEWACDAGSQAAYLEAAEAMVRLSAQDPVAFGYRGDARLKAGDRPGAKEDFRRAFTLAPDYGFAAISLFDLELADLNLEAASKVLEVFKPHDSGEYVLAREVQLAAARADRPAAGEALERVCTAPAGNSEWPLWAADKAFKDNGWDRQAEAIYSGALDRSDVHPQVGSLWIEHCASRGHWRCARRLGGLLAQGEVGRRAMVAYLQAVGRAKKSGKIAGCLRRHRQILREHTPCWGIVGYALTSIERHRAAAEWLRDWPDRRDAQPWMLINLVIALRALRRDDQANAVSRHALQLEADYTTASHAIWLALDELLKIDGDGSAAAARLDGLDPARFDQTNQYLFKLARLLVQRAQAQPAERASVRRATSRDLASMTRTSFIPAEDHGAVLHAYNRAVRRMARDHGPVAGLLWKLARQLHAPRKQR
jgi:hypothetical protein